MIEENRSIQFGGFVMFHSPTCARRVRGAVVGAAVVATVSLLVPTVANAAGYSTNLPHYESIALVRAALSGGGTVGFYLRTNAHGQVIHAVVGDTHLTSASCPGEPAFYLDTNGGSQILSNGGNELTGVGAAGTFNYKELFLSTPYTMTVVGRLSARGNDVSGTVTIVSATPGTVNGVSGCTDPTAHSTFSAKIHWKKLTV
jgi:hypothetical protein